MNCRVHWCAPSNFCYIDLKKGPCNRSRFGKEIWQWHLPRLRNHLYVRLRRYAPVAWWDPIQVLRPRNSNLRERPRQQHVWPQLLEHDGRYPNQRGQGGRLSVWLLNWSGRVSSTLFGLLHCRIVSVSFFWVNTVLCFMSLLIWARWSQSSTRLVIFDI